MRLRRRLAMFVLGLATTLAVHATVDPSLYQGLSWRLIGPFRGGRVLTVTGIPGDSRHLQVIARGGYVDHAIGIQR